MHIWPSINLDRLSRSENIRTPEASLKLYQDYESFDGIHMIDIQGIERETPQASDKIINLIKQSELPVIVGGGINTIETIEQYLNHGVASIVIGNKGLNDLLWLKQITQKYPDKIYLAVNANVNEVMKAKWQKTSRLTVSDIVDKVKDYQLKGIIYKDISKDGKLIGPNLEMNKELVQITNLPIIAAGGIRDINDIHALESVGVAGCIVDRACETEAFFTAFNHRGA